VEEAVAGGKALKADGFSFDVAHTSVLKRAQGSISLSSISAEKF
jgi:bisphosphoglycerate-dependent phosphoglycerate mutase